MESSASRPSLWLFALLIAACAAADAAPAGPAIAVSPGEADRAVEVATACPSFSWAAVRDASGYELVVLDIARPEEPAVVLRRAIAGSAFSWTPGRAECLAPGGTFAWTVRALDAAGQPLGAEEGWATLRRFTVPAMPSAAEVAAAMAVMRRWQAGEAAGTLPGTLPAPADGAAGAPVLRAAEVSGTSAIRGENPSTSGSQFGVTGQAVSLQGAGLVGINISIGPDLILDGSFQGQADTHFTQSGIDRPSASAQSFGIQNSGGGGMTLQVQGAAVSLAGHTHTGEEVTSGTVADARVATSLARDAEVFGLVLAADGAGSTLDADLLDGIQGASFQRRVSGSCPLGQAVQAVNADGSVVCYEVPIPPRITTADSTGDVGWYTSLALGADGFPVISYLDVTNGDLKVVKCNDAACAPGGETITTVDSTGLVGWDTSLALGTDGFPVISYNHLTNGDLKVVKCNDAACAPGGETISTVDGTGTVGAYTSLALGADDFPVISYYDNTSGDLKVVKCNDAACAPGGETITTVDSTGAVGAYTSLALGTDGFPVISYYDNTNGDLKVVKCNDAACAPGGETITTVDSTGVVGWNTSLALGTDGFPVISYYDLTNGDLKVVKCNDDACAPGGETITTVDSTGSVGAYSSLALSADGFPIISYSDSTNGDLKVVKCNDDACAPGGETITTVDSTGVVGAYNSLALGTDGFPVIGYYDGSTADLEVAKCKNASCRY